MRIQQRQWTAEGGWRSTSGEPQLPGADLVLFFGDREAIAGSESYDAMRAAFPRASLLGCSTSGEIAGTEVFDASVVATAVQFESTTVRTAFRAFQDVRASGDVGEQLGHDLPHEGLVHVFVLAKGIGINGSELANGLRRGLPSGVAVTGGLAGDRDRFERTLVRLDDRMCADGVAVVGFYGTHLRVGYGSMGGWDQFGPERLVTRSDANILYELDGRSALDLYKSYLGPYAAGLPASGLLFPLSVRTAATEQFVVRTILGVDEAAGSLVFAGDIPLGAHARLMRANVDRLIDGATGAASACGSSAGTAPELAILISCVGRKLVLKQRVEEEVESVRDVLGEGTALTGFYSYGELAPFTTSDRCELHNQTMTITTLSEA